MYHEGQTLATSNLLPNTIKDCSDKTVKNIMSQNIVRKRPPIVINNFPENQTVFPKKKIVPGELPFSDAVKNKATNPLNDAVKNKTTNPTINFFSDSIAKGIRLRESLTNMLNREKQECIVFQELHLHNFYII